MTKNLVVLFFLVLALLAGVLGFYTICGLSHKKVCRVGIALFGLCMVVYFSSLVIYSNYYYNGPDNLHITTLAQVTSTNAKYVPTRYGGSYRYSLSLDQGGVEYAIGVGYPTFQVVNVGDYVEVEYNVKDGEAIERRILQILPTTSVDAKVLGSADGSVELVDVAGNTYTVESDGTYDTDTVVRLSCVTYKDSEVYFINELGG